jgi:hypothetical protein
MAVFKSKHVSGLTIRLHVALIVIGAVRVWRPKFFSPRPLQRFALRRGRLNTLSQFMWIANSVWQIRLLKAVKN